jgi:hypothetical protein
LYQNLLADISFHQLLLKYDHDMADSAKEQGCHCGGALHSAQYRRKTKGLPAGLDNEVYCRRFSLCCALDGCQQHMTAPSLRFLGRRVYLASMVVLISTMLHGATPPRMARLSQLFGVDRRPWRAGGNGGERLSPRAGSGTWRGLPSCRRSIRIGCLHPCFGAF